MSGVYSLSHRVSILFRIGWLCSFASDVYALSHRIVYALDRRWTTLRMLAHNPTATTPYTRLTEGKIGKDALN